MRFFGSWRRAQEAFDLSDRESPRAIEARFKRRRLGKVWRYSEEALRESLAQAAEHWGRAPPSAYQSSSIQSSAYCTRVIATATNGGSALR